MAIPRRLPSSTGVRIGLPSGLCRSHLIVGLRRHGGDRGEIRRPRSPYGSEEAGEGEIPVGSGRLGARACVLGQHRRAPLITRVRQCERERGPCED